MPVLMRGKKIAVEKLKTKSGTASFIAMPDDATAVGVIRFVGQDLASSDLKVGMKVYYGKNRHEIKMDGVDVLVMDEDNVYAIADGEAAAK